MDDTAIRRYIDRLAAEGGPASMEELLVLAKSDLSTELREYAEGKIFDAHPKKGVLMEIVLGDDFSQLAKTKAGERLIPICEKEKDVNLLGIMARTRNCPENIRTFASNALDAIRLARGGPKQLAKRGRRVKIRLPPGPGKGGLVN